MINSLSNLESTTADINAVDAWRELQKLRKEPLGSLQTSNGKLIMELHKALFESITPQLSTYHKSEEKKHKVPYWEIPYTNSISLQGFQYDHDLYTIGGLITRIPFEIRAVATDLAAVVYGEELLKFGERAYYMFRYDQKKASVWKQTQEINLIRTMVGEFKQDHVMGLVVGKYNKKHLVLGSIGAVHGVGDRNVLDTVGADGLSNFFNIPSSLPTNYSLYFQVTEGVRKILTNDGERSIKEEQVSEITRLCKARELHFSNNLDSSSISAALFALIHPIIYKGTPNVIFVEFNTTPFLHKYLTDPQYGFCFPTIKAAQEGSIFPTEGIKRTIYGEYFTRKAVIPQFMNIESAISVSKRIEGMLTKK